MHFLVSIVREEQKQALFEEVQTAVINTIALNILREIKRLRANAVEEIADISEAQQSTIDLKFALKLLEMWLALGSAKSCLHPGARTAIDILNDVGDLGCVTQAIDPLSECSKIVAKLRENNTPIKKLFPQATISSS